MSLRYKKFVHLHTRARASNPHIFCRRKKNYFKQTKSSIISPPVVFPPFPIPHSYKWKKSNRFCFFKKEKELHSIFHAIHWLAYTAKKKKIGLPTVFLWSAVFGASGQLFLYWYFFSLAALWHKKKFRAFLSVGPTAIEISPFGFAKKEKKYYPFRKHQLKRPPTIPETLSKKLSKRNTPRKHEKMKKFKPARTWSTEDRRNPDFTDEEKKTRWWCGKPTPVA